MPLGKKLVIGRRTVSYSVRVTNIWNKLDLTNGDNEQKIFSSGLNITFVAVKAFPVKTKVASVRKTIILDEASVIDLLNASIAHFRRIK